MKMRICKVRGNTTYGKQREWLLYREGFKPFSFVTFKSSLGFFVYLCKLRKECP